MRRAFFSQVSISLCLFWFGALGCVQRGFNNRSEIRESFGNYNTAEGLGLSPDALHWEKIKKEVRGARPTAWSDTWWPHYSKGIADRYLLRTSAKKSENLEGSEVILSRFVEQYAAAVSKNDPRELALLSPAEKYDFLMSKEQIKEDFLAKIKIYSQKYYASNAAKILSSLERKLEKLGQYDNNYKALNQEYATEAKAHASTFKPLLVEGLALNEQLKKILPVTAHDWNLWLETFSWAHDEEWAWMGICNGWSPAALREAQPRQAVMAIRGAKRILLTEGDIRGLLSWVWGWQFPAQTLGAGVRCDAKQSGTIVKSRRVVDGRLCEGKGSRPGRCVSANTIYIGSDDPFARVPGRTLKFGLDPQSRNSHEAKLKSFLGNAFYEAEVKDLGSGVKRNLLIQLTQGCRDMNPGLFHAALVDLVGRRKIGFVVDADRYTQVWNQPVFGYELTYLPILKKDGSEAAAGVPVPLAEINGDPYSAFRSDKAEKIVQVRAKVVFGSENGPFAAYGSGGEKETHEEMTVDYTIEISGADQIVGGEWGLLPGTPRVKPLRVSNFDAAVAPDFIWNYPEDSLPLGDLVDYKIVKKIHECSTRQGATSTFDLKPYWDEPLAYVDCKLD